MEGTETYLWLILGSRSLWTLDPRKETIHLTWLQKLFKVGYFGIEKLQLWHYFLSKESSKTVSIKWITKQRKLPLIFYNAHHKRSII